MLELVMVPDLKLCESKDQICFVFYCLQHLVQHLTPNRYENLVVE